MLKHLIEQWLGEEKETYHPNNQHQEDVSIAYNDAISDLKSRIPELEEMIFGEIEKEKTNLLLSMLEYGHLGAGFIDGVRLLIESREIKLQADADIITSLKGDKE